MSGSSSSSEDWERWDDGYQSDGSSGSLYPYDLPRPYGPPQSTPPSSASDDHAAAKKRLTSSGCGSYSQDGCSSSSHYEPANAECQSSPHSSASDDHATAKKRPYAEDNHITPQFKRVRLTSRGCESDAEDGCSSSSHLEPANAECQELYTSASDYHAAAKKRPYAEDNHIAPRSKRVRLTCGDQESDAEDGPSSSSDLEPANAECQGDSGATLTVPIAEEDDDMPQLLEELRETLASIHLEMQGHEDSREQRNNSSFEKR